MSEETAFQHYRVLVMRAGRNVLCVNGVDGGGYVDAIGDGQFRRV